MELLPACRLDCLPPDCWPLLGSGPLTGAAWYGAIAAHALPPGQAAAFAVLREAGVARAVIPLIKASGGLAGLTTPYTLTYTPVLGPCEPALMHEAGVQLGRLCRAWPTVRLDAIPAEWPGLRPLIAGLRRAGVFAQRFDHFGNWHEPVAGCGWAAYLGARPGELRTTVGRKLKRAERDARLEVVRGGERLEPAIAAFEAVYSVSWKQPEPFPEFNPALIRAAAAQGALRLGVLWVGERPAAVQFWVVADGCATVLKLAHDEAFKPLSPGTVLTAMMVRSLLDEEHVEDLDFGRGDDPYKAAWTTRRRQRIGLILMNPRRIGGLLALGRSVARRLR